MKIKSVIILSVGIAFSATSFAQTSNLRKAAAGIQKFDEFRVAGSPQLGKSYIETAQQAIDAAAIHEKTKENPETWTYYALVYSNLASSEKNDDFAAKAKEGITKAKSFDTDKKFKDNIEVAEQILGSYKFNQGVGFWEKSDFKSAFGSFNSALEFMPGDTTLTYYSALAAIQNKDYKEAIARYKLLVDKPTFSSHKTVMVDLPKLFISAQDTASALEYAAKATEAYPDDKAAAVQNIEFNLIANKHEKIISGIQSQIQKDPTNKSLFYYLGLAEAGNNNPAKALEAYKKAIEIDPNYSDANLNAGVTLMNQVSSELIELNNNTALSSANRILKQKELKEKLKPIEGFFSAVLVTEPSNLSALKGLKQYYDFIENEAKSKEVNQKLEALEK